MFRSQVPLVCIVLDEDQITLSLFKQTTTTIYLGAQRIVPLHSLEIVGQNIINLSRIVSLIRQFIEHNKIKNSYGALSVSPSLSWHYCSAVDEQHPLSESREIPTDTVWNSVAVLQEEKKLGSYFFGVKRNLIFSYQLIALMTPFKAILLTTHMRALLHGACLYNKSVHEIFDTNLEIMKNNSLSYLKNQKNVLVESSIPYERNEQWYISLGLYLMSKEL